jgi:hypothetical protein
MKNKILFSFLLIFSFTFIASAVSAQTISVTPVKTIYTRPKPESKWKKRFTVTRPKIKGTTPALAKKIETAVSYEKNFEFKLQEEIKEYQWLSEASYTLDYNKKGILGVSLTMDGSAAYPDSSTRSVVVNIKTGNRVVPADVFTNIDGLVSQLSNIQKAEVKQALIDIKKENPDEEGPGNLFENVSLTAEDLKEFDVNDRGIRFWYDYGFPHVIQAWQPEGKYFMTWSQMKPYIKQGSLFAQFIH